MNKNNLIKEICTNDDYSTDITLSGAYILMLQKLKSTTENCKGQLVIKDKGFSYRFMYTDRLFTNDSLYKVLKEAINYILENRILKTNLNKRTNKKYTLQIK